MNRVVLIAAFAVVGVLCGCAKPQSNSETSPSLKPSETLPAEISTPERDPQANDVTMANVSMAPAQPVVTQVVPIVQDPVIARVDGTVITRSQVVDPLMKTRGLEMLLRVLQLEMARTDAASRGIILNSDDFEKETRITLRYAFGAQDESALLEAKTDEERAVIEKQLADERDQMIEQFVRGQNQTRIDFDMLMQTNAYLRAIVMPMIRAQITDDILREAFNTMHGEKVRIRHIALTNMQEVAKAKARLDAGEPFENVAREMSRSSSASVGGELPPFTRLEQDISKTFIDAAFALQPGQISDPIQLDGLYHIIQLEEKIPPKAVKFEDVKESVRAEYENTACNKAMNELRRSYARRVLQAIEIEDEELKKQFEEKKAAAEPKPVDRDEVLEQIPVGEIMPATQPAKQPSTTQPVAP